MKRYLIAFFVLLSSVAISQDIANHSMPIGGGPGAVGWKTGGPCSAGQALVWAGAGVDPTCTSVSGSGSTPGGSNGDIQYNNAGTFGGIAVGTGLTNSGTALNCTNGTAAVKGCLQTDGATIAVASGVVSCRTGTAAVVGCVRADGTTILATAGVLSVAPSTATTLYPGGRLVLDNVGCSAQNPIRLTDLFGGQAACYVPYTGTGLTINGANYTFTILQLTMTAAKNVAGNNYDIFAVVNAGAAALCTNDSQWASSTSRGSATIARTGFLWKNSTGIIHCWNNGVDMGTFNSGEALYLGTVYMTADGLSQWVLNPNAATGGTDNVLGIYNAYNRVRVLTVERELTPNWTYSTGTWRCVQGSCNNRIRTIDGLGLSQQEITTLMTIDTGDDNVNGGSTTVCIDCSPADTPGLVIQANNQAGFGKAGFASNQGQTIPGKGFYSGLGLHTFTFLEIGGGGTFTEWFGNTYSGMFVALDN